MMTDKEHILIRKAHSAFGSGEVKSLKNCLTYQPELESIWILDRVPYTIFMKLTGKYSMEITRVPYSYNNL